MGLTTKLQLPYPEQTDSVDVVRDVKALAEKIDTTLKAPTLDGFARAQTTQALSHGAGTWNTAQLDVLTDKKGDQPWTLDAGNRRLQVTAAGVYLLQASLTMTGPLALAIGVSSNGGSSYNRCAVVPIGTVAYTNTVSVIRYLPLNCMVQMFMYHAAAQSIVADTTNSPSYLAIQALGTT